MSTKELIDAINKLVDKPEAENLDYLLGVAHALIEIISFMEGRVILPVEDLEVMIKRDGGVNDLDAYCLAMGPIALTDHVLSMLSTITKEDNSC